jgi:hypothetical protein
VEQESSGDSSSDTNGATRSRRAFMSLGGLIPLRERSANKPDPATALMGKKAKKKKHVLDIERRRQNVPPGFVVAEEASAGDKPTHFKELESVLQSHAAVAHHLRDRIVDQIKNIRLPLFVTAALQKENKLGEEVLNAIISCITDTDSGRALSPIEQQTLCSFRTFRLCLNFQELLHGQVGPTFMSALGIAWPEVAKRIPNFANPLVMELPTAPVAAPTPPANPVTTPSHHQLRSTLNFSSSAPLSIWA